MKRTKRTSPMNHVSWQDTWWVNLIVAIVTVFFLLGLLNSGTWAFNKLTAPSAVKLFVDEVDARVAHAVERNDYSAGITVETPDSDAATPADLELMELKVCWLKEHGWNEISRGGYWPHQAVTLRKSLQDLPTQTNQFKKAVKNPCPPPKQPTPYPGPQY